MLLVVLPKQPRAGRLHLIKEYYYCYHYLPQCNYRDV